MSFGTSTSSCLVEAISFLTQPLSPTIPHHTICTLQQILLSTLAAAPSWLRNGRITLGFSSTAPPRAVFTACAATRIEWSHWFLALGGRGFDLFIDRSMVSVQVAGISGQALIWKEVPNTRPAFNPSIISPRPSLHVRTPIKLCQSIGELYLAPSASARSKTLAQQILHSAHEEEEADEIFAMISKLDSSTLISPTPACDRIDIPKAPVTKAPVGPQLTPLPTLDEETFHSQPPYFPLIPTRNTPSPVSSTDSSCPNSPYSTFSYSSSQESLTSLSSTSTSVSSSPIKALTKPSIPSSKCNPPRCPDTILPAYEATTIKKPQVQRYLYQGGQSTTLTGGVMLGSASASKMVMSTPMPLTPANSRFTGRRRKTVGITPGQARQSGTWNRTVPSCF